MIIWLTGLPCSGKTTIGRALLCHIRNSGQHAVLIDGDETRRELWPELGFSREDRDENIRRFGVIARAFSGNGVTAIVSAVSPYSAARDAVRRLSAGFLEVYVDAPLAVCEQRDVKGMYAKARSGELPHFTGIDDPYEPPAEPEVACRTDQETIEESVSKIVAAYNFTKENHASKVNQTSHHRPNGALRAQASSSSLPPVEPRELSHEESARAAEHG